MNSQIMKVITVLTGISTLLLGCLMYIYIKNLRKIKSKFTIGLLIFALLFFVQNLVSLFYFITMMDYYSPEIELHVFLFTLLQVIGFAVLLKITWE